MKSILFTKEMLLAVLEGRKTQTRRLIKNISIENYREEVLKREGKNFKRYIISAKSSKKGWSVLYHGDNPIGELNSRYSLGDLVYVKEPAYISPENFDESLANFPNGVEVGYTYSMNLCSIAIAKGYKIKETKAVFLPEKYSRIKLRITDIFVQQIQDISDSDCIKEGIQYSDLFKKYQVKIDNEYKRSQDPKKCFEWLWESIHGKDDNKCWKYNPWVFVYDFELAEVRQ